MSTGPASLRLVELSVGHVHLAQLWHLDVERADIEVPGRPVEGTPAQSFAQVGRLDIMTR